MLETLAVERRPVINFERLEEVVFRAIEGRRQNEGLFVEGYKPPELAFIELAKEYGKQTGNPSFALHALAQYITALFSDNSTLQLKRAAKPSDFEKYKWLYEPKEVVNRSQEEVVSAATALVKPSQNAVALEEWKHNSEVIVNKYEGDMKNFFAEHNFEAPKLLEALTNSKNKVEGFRRYGPKIASLFLLWVDHYDLVGRKLTYMQHNGIQVDFQIIRLCVQTGALKLDKPTHTTTVTSILIDAFQKLCLKHCTDETGLTPEYISETLWFIGHRGCNEMDHSRCPIEDMCTSMLWRIPYDRLGIISPRDHGRYDTKDVIKARLVQARLRNKQRAHGQLPFDEMLEEGRELDEYLETIPEPRRQWEQK